MQKTARTLQDRFKTTSSTIEVKDGTWAQVFVNVIPRKQGDLPENDKIYEFLECALEADDNEELYGFVDELRKNSEY